MRLLSPYRLILLTSSLSVIFFVVSFYLSDRPRVWAAKEVPIAFWAWRIQAPEIVEVQKAFATTNGKTLFLRAGQFDLVNGKVERIRPVAGTLPNAPELHLVYNGTRRFLQDWEHLTPEVIADIIAQTYQSDLNRSANDQVKVSGIQLDLDSPQRLLPYYGKILRQLRGLLPAGTKLSITGLPSWMTSNEIQDVLSQVDFWIPQCYGAAIPTNVNQHIPIASLSDVTKTVARARGLNKPFWAGLSAYSYAILYDKDGQLVELRGDIDPALASRNHDLELTGSSDFQNKGTTGESRYVYRAKSDLILDGLIMRTGESLVFELPNGDSLRASARAVRENAGELLLGICIFRLPSSDDEATLTNGEISAALSDRQAEVSTSVKIGKIADKRMELRANNLGDAAAFGDGALTIDLQVPAGSITGVTQISGFAGYETLCEIETIASARPCSSRRANVIRLKASAWKAGDTAAVTFVVKDDLPSMVHGEVRSRSSPTYTSRQSLDLQLNQSEK